MPRGGPAANPRLTMTNASTDGNLGTCPGRDTRCLCASGAAPAYRWDAGILWLVVTVVATLSGWVFACGVHRAAWGTLKPGYVLC